MQPLKGILVLDFTYFYPGGYCTRFLADYGAKILKIQRPEDLLDIPTLWPWDDDAASTNRRERSGRFIQFNRNKHSLECNYTTPEGVALLTKLIKKADVLVEGFRPGVMKNLALDYSAVKHINPDLIYCSISGFGQKGNLSEYPAHDLNIQGMSGLLSLNSETHEPSISGIPIADIISGHQAAIAVVLALLDRCKSKRGGQHLDISMLDSLSWATGLSRSDAYWATGHYIRAHRRHIYFFHTKDHKHICIQPLEYKFWEKLCRGLGLDECIGQWRDIQPFSEDTEHRRHLADRLQERFSRQTRHYWCSKFHDCCVTPIMSFEEAFDPQNPNIANLVEWEQDPELGKIPVFGPPFKMRGSGTIDAKAPPLKGEHTEAILREWIKEDPLSSS